MKILVWALYSGIAMLSFIMDHPPNVIAYIKKIPKLSKRVIISAHTILVSENQTVNC